MENKQIPDWKQLLEKFKVSYQSARQFATEQKISYHALQYHLRKERTQSDSCGDSPG